VEYAQSRLDKKTLSSVRWAKVIREVNGNAELSEISPAVRGAIEAEREATLAALKQTHTALDRARSILGGMHETEEGRKVVKR